MAGKYVYAEAAKLVPIWTTRGKFSEFRTFEIESAGFSGPIQRALAHMLTHTQTPYTPPVAVSGAS